MVKEKYPIQLMVELCKEALLRSRRRVYYRCFKDRAEKVDDSQVVVEHCRKLASKVKVFHKHDFEVVARAFITKYRRYDIKLSSLLRKLRALANDPDHTWIKWYRGDWGRRNGLYELNLNIEDQEEDAFVL